MLNRASHIAAMILLLAPASAVAEILIDDFTQTSDPSLYPFGSPTVGYLEDVFDPFDPIRNIENGEPFVRSIVVFNGPSFNTTVSLDTGEGSLSFMGDSAANGPIFILSYFNGSRYGGVIDGLGSSIDVSGETALRLHYQTSAPVAVEVRLSSGETDDGLTQGNTAFIELDPDRSLIDIPLSSITGDAIGSFFAAAPGTDGSRNGNGELLDDFDPGDLDRLSLVFENFGPSPVPTTPGLTFTFQGVEFVPEPNTAALFVVASAALVGRRRR